MEISVTFILVDRAETNVERTVDTTVDERIELIIFLNYRSSRSNNSSCNVFVLFSRVSRRKGGARNTTVKSDAYL